MPGLCGHASAFLRHWSHLLLLGVVLIVLLGAACTAAPAPAPIQPAAPAQQPLLPADNAPDEAAPPVDLAPVEPLPEGATGKIDLVGIWTSEETTEYGTVYAETILERNHNYSHQVRWMDLMTYEVGVYQAGDNFIHFSVRDYQPKSYKGTELSRPLSWTVYYTVVDENTMIWEDRIMNTRWQVHRRGW